MIIEHFIMAKSAAVDATTNQLSLFELIEDITVPAASFPIEISVNVVGVLRREPNETGEIARRFEFAVRGPGDVQILFDTLEVRLERQHRRNRVRFLLNLSLATPGAYTASLRQVDAAEVARTIEFTLISAPTAAPGTMQ